LNEFPPGVRLLIGRLGGTRGPIGQDAARLESRTVILAGSAGILTPKEGNQPDQGTGRFRAADGPATHAASNTTCLIASRRLPGSSGTGSTWL